MRDTLGLAQHWPDLAAVLAAKVTAHALPQIGGLAHIQHLARSIVKQVDAGCARQMVGEFELGDLWMPADLGKSVQIVEAHHAKRRGAFDEQMQQVGCGERVVEGSVAWLMGQPKACCQGAEFAVGHFVA